MTVLARPAVAVQAVNGHRAMDLQDFLALPEGPPYYEFEEGKLIVMPRPHPRHQRILMRLANRLDQYCQTYNRGSIWPEIEILLPGQTRVYIPDLVYLTVAQSANLPKDSSRFHVVPDLVIEILSPSTRQRDRSTKMQTYQAAGCRGTGWLNKMISLSKN